VRLIRVEVGDASSCGGLLDGFELQLRRPGEEPAFEPVCLIGPNGAGKSQFLQVLAEIFQSLFHACSPEEERAESNPELTFEIEWEIQPEGEIGPVRVRASRGMEEGRAPREPRIERRADLGWRDCSVANRATRALLPSGVVAYTSGDNETLSAPFMVSRGAYADDVAEQALERSDGAAPSPEPRLLLIDYATHLEVLVANLLLGDPEARRELLAIPRLRDVHSFRCLVQLRPRSGPRKGVRLTPELEEALDHLRRCATSFDFDSTRELHTFDFLLTAATREAFAHFWNDAFDLYTTFHKLGLLNDLAIPRPTRQRFRRQINARRFSPRLPEPQDEDKVFRLGQLMFHPREGGDQSVDYVSLSDGEHQLALLLGTMAMVSRPNVVFLLDEPESHFNPEWRIDVISRILELPTRHGARAKGDLGGAAAQECLLTTHAPFVASDLPGQRVLVFAKDESGIRVRRPEVETYGATFDTILNECFEVSPPISGLARKEIAELRQSEDPIALRAGLRRLGPSVEKAFVADQLLNLEREDEG
jgi:restriction system-associated AAA family ATPase